LGLCEPVRGPRVLFEKPKPLREFFYRVMYVVFLFYCVSSIGLGLSSLFSLISYLVFGPAGVFEVFSSLFFLALLVSLGRVRNFWRDHWELYRMEDNFCGVAYLSKHLESPKWPEVRFFFGELSRSGLSPIDKDAVRRSLACLARESSSLHEVIHELGDDRLRGFLCGNRS